MGASHSAGTNKLAITAMSHVVHFTRDELLSLQKEFLRVAKASGDNENTITRAQFHDALHIVKVEESDKELLDRLFTMFDDTGDGQINFKEFVCGVSTILRGTLEEKLTCALRAATPYSSSGVSCRARRAANALRLLTSPVGRLRSLVPPVRRGQLGQGVAGGDAVRPALHEQHSELFRG